MKKIIDILKGISVVSDAVTIAGLAVVKAVKAVVEGIKDLFSKKEDGNGILPLFLLAAVGLAAGYLLSGPVDGMVMAFAVVAGVAGKGEHVVDAPLTTNLADTVSPGLLRNEIDDRIVKIRPMSTPLDQISRYGGARLCGSMKVDYYSVDTRPTEDAVKEAYDPGRTPANGVVEIKVNTPAVFEPSTTLLVPSVKATKGGSLVLYVVSRDTASIKVMAVNNFAEGSEETCVPALPAGTKLVRMGRAAAELDVMTAQFEALPKKETNYCQIFK